MNDNKGLQHINGVKTTVELLVALILHITSVMASNTEKIYTHPVVWIFDAVRNTMVLASTLNQRQSNTPDQAIPRKLVCRIDPQHKSGMSLHRRPYHHINCKTRHG